VSDGFGLYVHVPYCRTKCPYCDFNVRAGATWPESRYTDALIAELGRYAIAAPFMGKRLETIFFGGGTPSLFSARSIARVLAACRSSFDLSVDAEISLEANPETVFVEGLCDLRRAGVSRLSFGVESFQPKILKRLGRLQTAAETRLAVPMAREAGFTNVSLDLMFAIPGQTLDDWREDLETAISFRPEHISAYNLTYEEGTPFFDLRRAGKLVPLDDEVEAVMFEEARRLLGEAAYRAYEVSNFALPGCEARHNLNYWQTGDYLGIGAGAHSHERQGSRARRWSNAKDPEQYVAAVLANGTAVASEEMLEPEQAAGEFAFLHLRLADGLAEEDFGRRFGRALAEMFPGVEGVIAAGLLQRRGGRVSLTRRGLLVADSVFASFL
jgi:putative oxygen-independent coproporphyrinogen III oxidase